MLCLCLVQSRSNHSANTLFGKCISRQTILQRRQRMLDVIIICLILYPKLIDCAEQSTDTDLALFTFNSFAKNRWYQEQPTTTINKSLVDKITVCKSLIFYIPKLINVLCRHYLSVNLLYFTSLSKLMAKIYISSFNLIIKQLIKNRN